MSANPPRLFDRDLHAARIGRVCRTKPDVLWRAIAAELGERLALIARHFGTALVVASDTAEISRVLRESGKAATIEVRQPAASDDLSLRPESYEAIFSLLDLHAVNDVPGALAQFRRALKPDGLFMACLFAGGTLTELRQSWLAAEVETTGGASPRVAPMIGVRELGALMQRAGLALPVADLDRTTVRYADPFALMAEIKALGLSNALIGRARVPVTRGLLGAAARHYRERFSDADGRIRATVEIAWATAWAPHENQPKPLKPGSAKARLADALGVTERKLDPR